MFFSFDENVAKLYGVDGAIFIQNLYWWITKNRANGRHLYDGRYWTYNSVSAWGELFPFWTDKQIRRIIENLHDAGALHIGEYNKNGFDRTKWYALDETVLDIYRNGQMDLPKRANENCPNGQMRFAQMGEPIPDINTDIKPDSEKDILSGAPDDAGEAQRPSASADLSGEIPPRSPGRTGHAAGGSLDPQIEEGEENGFCRKVIDYLNSRCGKHYRTSTPKTRALIAARRKEGFVLADFLRVIDNKSGWKGTDMDKYLRPETLFGPKFEGYLNEGVRNGPSDGQPDFGGKAEKIYGTIM